MSYNKHTDDYDLYDDYDESREKEQRERERRAKAKRKDKQRNDFINEWNSITEKSHGKKSY